MATTRSARSPEQQRRADRAKALAKANYRLRFALIAARKAAGFSQEQVAARIGVSQQAVSKFEALDSDPKLSTVRSYAHAVGAVYEALVRLDDGLIDLSNAESWMIEMLEEEPDAPVTFISSEPGPRRTQRAVHARFSVHALESGPDGDRRQLTFVPAPDLEGVA